MIFDMQQATFLEGIIAFPDYAFAGLPCPPSACKETVMLTGQNTATSIKLTGSVGQTNIQVGNPPFPGS